jgi:hypothetical protein
MSTVMWVTCHFAEEDNGACLGSTIALVSAEVPYSYWLYLLNMTR